MGNDKLKNKQLEMLSGCLDGELRGDELTKLAELLADDPSAAAEMADLLKVKSMVKELPTVKPPRNYRLTTLEAEEARPKPFWERIFPILRGAAAFCALALAFVFLFPQLIENAFTGISGDAAAVPVAKSLSFDADTFVGITDEEIFLEEDRTDLPSNALPASMPSYGVRGGSPRSEYLMMEAERLQQPVLNTALSDSADFAAEALTLTKIILAFLLVVFAAAAFLLGKKKKKLELKDG